MNTQHTKSPSAAIQQGKKKIETPFRVLMIVSALMIAGMFALRFAGLFALSNILTPIYGVAVLGLNQWLKNRGSQQWQLWVLLNTEDLHTAEREGIRRNWLNNKGLRDQKMLKKLSQEDRLKVEKRLAGFSSQNQYWQDISEIPWEMAYYVEQKQVKKEIQSLALMILAPLVLYAFMWTSFKGFLWVKIGLGVVCLVYVVNFVGKILHYRTLKKCDEPMFSANSEEIKYYDGKQAIHFAWRNLESVLLQGKDLKVIYNDKYLKTTKNKDKTEHLALNFLYIPNQENFENLLDFYQQRFIKYRKDEDLALVA